MNLRIMKSQNVCALWLFFEGCDRYETAFPRKQNLIK